MRVSARLHRRVLPIARALRSAAAIALAAIVAGCSARESTGSTGSDAPDAGAADSGAACLACGSVDPWDDVDGSIGLRAQRRLAACNGFEGCHVSSAAGLTYPSGAEASLLIGVPSSERPDMVRVKPGDPSASYLYLKVLGDGGIEGGRMPLGSPFDPRVPALFFTWIEAGAPPP